MTYKIFGEILQWNDLRHKIYESWGLVLWVNWQYVSKEKSDICYSAKKFAQIHWCHKMLTAVAKCATQKCGMPRLAVIEIEELYWYYLSKVSLALLLSKNCWKGSAGLYINIYTPTSILEGPALSVSLSGVKLISLAELRLPSHSLWVVSHRNFQSLWEGGSVVLAPCSLYWDAQSCIALSAPAVCRCEGLHWKEGSIFQIIQLALEDCCVFIIYSSFTLCIIST